MKPRHISCWMDLQRDANSQNHIPYNILPLLDALPLVGNIIRVAPTMLAKARNGSSNNEPRLCWRRLDSLVFYPRYKRWTQAFYGAFRAG